MKWEIDPKHSVAEFSIRSMTGRVRGHLGLLSGSIHADESTPSEALIDATLDASSIDTGGDDRDHHLRSAGFLDVENYPTITFKSTRVRPQGNSHVQLIGDLTIRGLTREVALDVEFGGEGKDLWGNRRVSFSAQTKINRKDFGLVGNVPLVSGFLVGDELAVMLEIEATAAPVAAVAASAR